ncbi:MAG: GerMN domain-containing protein [Nitrospirae bacterium]|nr:GerMN domain-containing protein [Nitrospirota bacterium]
MSRKRIIWIIVLIIIFIFVTIAGYLYFSDMFSKDKIARETVQDIQDTEDLSTLRIYYPYENSLQQEERKIQRRISEIAIAEATIEEFLKGPAAQPSSLIPKDVSLIGVYKGADMILYVNLSDEFRRNFQGDALTEFLILKGLYESIISNVEDIHDLKILIEGKEVETLGGHLYLLYPLKDIVSIDITSQEVENIQQNPQKPE